MTNAQALALERLAQQLRASLKPLADADTCKALDMLSTLTSEVRNFVLTHEPRYGVDRDASERIVSFLLR